MDDSLDFGLPTAVINVYATTTEWILHDPILQDGQFGIEYDPSTGTSKAKAGWSGRRWSELPYIGDATAPVQGDNVPKVLDSIPSPTDGGMVLLSVGLGSLVWGPPDSGVFASPGVFAPRILRQPPGTRFGPPQSLPYGQLAVNLSGDLSSDSRPSLYIGGPDDTPIRLVSQQDLLINLKPRSYGATGGATVAEAVNAAPEPIQLAESELLVVTHDPYVYLFGGLPGRYGGVGYTGPGGPGGYVQMKDFIQVSVNFAPATASEIVNASAPDKSVNANTSLLTALETLRLQGGGAVPMQQDLSQGVILDAGTF